MGITPYVLSHPSWPSETWLFPAWVKFHYVEYQFMECKAMLEGKWNNKRIVRVFPSQCQRHQASVWIVKKSCRGQWRSRRDWGLKRSPIVLIGIKQFNGWLSSQSVSQQTTGSSTPNNSNTHYIWQILLISTSGWAARSAVAHRSGQGRVWWPVTIKMSTVPLTCM